MQGQLKLLGVGLAVLTIGVNNHVMAVSVPVMDSGFEDQVKAVGLATGPGSWNTGGGFTGGAGVYTPSPPIPGQDGSRVGRVYVRNELGSYGVQFQDSGQKIQEGTYLVNFKASYEPGYEPTSAILYLNFESIGAPGGESDKNFIGGDAFTPGSFDSTQMVDEVASVTIGPGSTSIGKYLRFYALAGGTDPGVNTTDPRATFDFDNVQLSYVPLEGGDPTPLPVGDPSFEAKAWQTGSNEDGSSGVYRPASPVFSNQQGSQLGYLSVRNITGCFAALFQDVTTIAAGTYTMTVAAGLDPSFSPTTSHFQINFESIGADGSKTELGQNSFGPTAVNGVSLTDLSAGVSIPVGAADIGKTLRLVLVNTDPDAGTNPSDPRATYLFDNVRLNFVAAGTTFTADFNGDGKVDGADLTKWKSSFGVNAGADADKDGDSDGADFLTWQKQLGSGATIAASGAVPEPTSICIALALIGMLFVVRQR